MSELEPLAKGQACAPAVPLEALPNRWRTLATSFEQFGGSTQAQTLRECASMLGFYGINPQEPAALMALAGAAS